MPDGETTFRDKVSGQVEAVKNIAGNTFDGFRESGIGQFAEALYVLQKEHPKKFWIFFFFQLWLMANGINHIADLWALVEKGHSIFTLINPFAG